MNRLGKSGFLFAAVAAATPAAATPSDQPIKLVATDLGSRIQLKVVGDSTTAVDATYALEVSGGPKSGSNKSVQRGHAALKPGVPVTLITLEVGTPAGSGWNARLHVETKSGEAYDIERRSDA